MAPKAGERVLVISWGIPPLPSGSAVVIGNLAKQFSCDEMIVTGERPYGHPAIAWRDSWPRLVCSVSGWRPSARGARWWRALQLPVLVLRCLWLARTLRCTAVLVVFPREEFLLAGYLTAVWTGARLFPYFHNTYVENRTGLSLRFARWLQGRVFGRATRVFVISDGLAALYRERYPGLECSTLPHSFDEAIPHFAPPPAVGSPLRFVISGTLNESCRDAAVRVCQAIARTEDASLTLLSGTPRAALNGMGFLRQGVRHETVSRDELVGRLQEADIVVLPHGFVGAMSPEEYRTIFPTRTIEYLICGRPILAHAPPDCYLTRFLTQHRCAMIVTEPSVTALAKAIDQLRSSAPLREELVRNALSAAEMFQARRVAASLRHHLGFE